MLFCCCCVYVKIKIVLKLKKLPKYQAYIESLRLFRLFDWLFFFFLLLFCFIIKNNEHVIKFIMEKPI